MPPNFQRRRDRSRQEVRKRHPGTGVVVLSQYDDPEYAVALLAEGSAGYGYLLKDASQKATSCRPRCAPLPRVAPALDPAIVDALVRPVRKEGDLDPADEALLTMVAEGKPIKAIAVAQRTTPEAVSAAVEELFLTLAKGVSAGADGALRRLRMRTRRSWTREEQGETLSRLLPGGLAEKLRQEGRRIGRDRAPCT